MKDYRFILTSKFKGALIIWMAVFVLISCTATADEQTKTQEIQNTVLIFVGGNDNRVVAIAAPLVRHLAGEGLAPYLFKGSTFKDLDDLIPASQMSKGKLIYLTPEAEPDAEHVFWKAVVERLVIDPNPMEAGIYLGQRYWKSLSSVVFAPADQPEAFLQGAVLATHMGVPFIPVTNGRAERKDFQDFLKSSELKQAILVQKDSNRNWRWLSQEISQVCALETLTPDKAYLKTIQLLDPGRIRNAIITRIKGNRTNEIWEAAFASPYLSLIRKSPVILCSSSDYREVEKKVAAMLLQECPNLRSITILADHHMIGLHRIAEWDRDGYDAEVEACSAPETGVAFSLSVGRIPFKKPELILAMISRGVMSERNLTQRSFRALMIGNPNTSYGPLPLCETMARATAEEFRNCRIIIDEYYGQVSTNPGMFKSVGKSQFIVFQGHITDLHFFGSSSEDKDDVFEQKWDEYWIEDTVVEDPVPDNQGNGRLQEVPVDEQDLGGPLFYQDAPVYNDGALTEDEGQEEWPAVEYEQVDIQNVKPVQSLTGYPFVILQSCHSLEEMRVNWIIRKGGIGLLGSTTNVHSASGSAFVKAFCDSLLYRGSTAGEALQDARNYFMCLDRLREQRGHKELAKMKRVAMSFRIWGDPEQRLLPVMNDRPLIAAVSGEFSGKRKFRIQTPLKKLKEAKTDKYILRCFPSSEAGAIVTRLKEFSYRKINSIYFFKLPVTDSFIEKGFTSIARPVDTDIRSVFIMDSLKRHLFILYYPEKEKKNGKYILEFKK